MIVFSFAPQISAAQVTNSSSDTSSLHIVAPPGNPTLVSALPLLANYLMRKVDGIKHVHPIVPRSYRYTGEKFESGQVNAFIGGSFLSYILCARDLAVPIARGESLDGTSSYHSVLLSRRNTPYNGVSSVKGKRITYVTEASSGEFYARKLFGGKEPTTVDGTTYIPSKSHELAIRFLRVGRADFAFVKNLVWEEIKEQYPELHMVDQDDGENPNNVFLVSKRVYNEYGDELQKLVLDLHNDPDPMAQHLMKVLNLKRFVATEYPQNFNHTAQLVEDAGIDAQSYQFNK
ncbi:MAG: phosphate/phosphite/phosphonate ABC transporter substrate-binding protein [Gammaproteobacteria bacterium]|nr:phosphate/phosphite/phosphonate ABC transporter substrate-binding protein [Gammaproteobacteria bacterium]